MAISHEFAWSVSRHYGFRECERRHYFDYYLSWRGWERNGDEERVRAYLLKKMTRLPMLAGTTLHDALAWWFAEKAAGRDRTEEEVAERAVTALRRGWVESRDGEWRKRPSKLTHLAEHHFGEPEVDETSDAARDYGRRYVERIRTGAATFFRSEELAEVRAAAPDTWLACEELGTIELFGEKVYAVPDFAHRSGDEVVIWDWKTGRPREQDAFQLALYALYAEDVWGVDPTTVRCADAYLPTGEVVATTFAAARLDEVRGEVEASMQAMRALHFDADASKGDAAAFPQIPADAPAARACGRCNYRELCER